MRLLQRVFFLLQSTRTACGRALWPALFAIVGCHQADPVVAATNDISDEVANEMAQSAVYVFDGTGPTVSARLACRYRGTVRTIATSSSPNEFDVLAHNQAVVDVKEYGKRNLLLVGSTSSARVLQTVEALAANLLRNAGDTSETFRLGLLAHSSGKLTENSNVALDVVEAINTRLAGVAASKAKVEIRIVQLQTKETCETRGPFPVTKADGSWGTVWYQSATEQKLDEPGLFTLFDSAFFENLSTQNEVFGTENRCTSEVELMPLPNGAQPSEAKPPFLGVAGFEKTAANTRLDSQTEYLMPTEHNPVSIKHFDSDARRHRMGANPSSYMRRQC